MKLTLDFKDAYISSDDELNDVRASYSKTGGSGGKLITIGHAAAKLQGGRRQGRSIANPRDHEISEQMAEVIIQLLTGKPPAVAPRERGWIGPTTQAFTCEPKKKSFIG